MNESQAQMKTEVEMFLATNLDNKYKKDGYNAAMLLILNFDGVFSNDTLSGYVKVGKFSKFSKNQSKAVLQVKIK